MSNLNTHHIITVIVFAFVFGRQVSSKCQNTTQFRYQLSQITQIQGYNSICSQFTSRTCCSPKNIEVLSKKYLQNYNRIIKAVSNGVQNLSIGCKHKLMQMMCSQCDGDIGEGQIEGICDNYCEQLYQICKNDLFIFQNSKLRVCKQQDLVCAKLMDIYIPQQNTKVCELYGFGQVQMGCWSGENSALTKGKAKKKLKYRYQRIIPGREKNQQKDQTVKYYLIILMFAVFGGLIFIKWGRGLFRNQHYHRLN